MTSALAVVATTALAGCGGSGGGSGEAGASGSTDHGPLTKTSVVLGFTASPNFAVLFAAKEEGYFADEGLDVTIIPGGPGVQGESLVASGKNDFVLGGMSDLPPAVEEGLPLIALAARDVHTEFGLVTAADSGIKTPKDLEGKTVALSQGATPTNLFPAFLKANGVDASKVHVVTVSANAVTSALLSGQADAVGGGGSTVVGIRQQQPDAGFLSYAEMGVDVLGSGLETRRELVEKNPDLVGAMVRAFDKAMKFTVDHPQKSVEDVAKSYPSEIGAYKDPVAILKFVNKHAEKPYGYMPPELWKTTVDNLVKAGLLKDGSNPEQYYTNKFHENK